MIETINCIDNTKKINYNRERLKQAKERINNFPVLNSIFKNFDNYQKEVEDGNDLPSNVLFNLFTSERYYESFTQNNLIQSQGAYFLLKKVEEYLQYLKNSKLRLDQKFINDLTSKDNFKSYSAYNETIFGYNLIKNPQIQKIEFYPSVTNGKNPDFSVFINEKKIIFELTGLNLRPTDLKIKK